jgi:hypothetical protein
MGDDQSAGGRVGSALDGVASQLTRLGLIVSAVIGFNTAVDGCVKVDEERGERFAQAVNAEQAYWKGLFDAYIEAASGSDDEVRNIRLLSLQSMAGRPPATFTGYRLGWFDDGAAQEEAAAYIRAMRAQLLASIRNPRTSGAQVANVAQVESFAGADETAIRPRQEQAVDEEAQRRARAEVAASAIARKTTETSDIARLAGTSMYSGAPATASSLASARRALRLNRLRRRQTLKATLAASRSGGSGYGRSRCRSSRQAFILLTVPAWSTTALLASARPQASQQGS